MMKFFVIFIMLSTLVGVVSALLYAVANANDNRPKKKRNVRNYKVRFDAAKEKYYLVNELETHDEPVTNSFGFRVMYKDKPKAEFVAEKYNA